MNIIISPPLKVRLNELIGNRTQPEAAYLSWALLTSIVTNGTLMTYLICVSKSLALVISNFSSGSSISYSQGKPFAEGSKLSAFCSGSLGSFEVT